MNFFVVLCAIVATIMIRLLSNPTVATMSYIFISYIFNYDADFVPIRNHDGEVEDSLFTHRFIHLDKTFQGRHVNVTYHLVECGNASAEPIVFGHGLGENWRVWKKIMYPFCGTHRAIAFDSEGMGQSYWPNIVQDVPVGESTMFMADMQMEMLRSIGVRCFNLVITDYTFWTTLAMLNEYGHNTILRYGKLQSVRKQ
jgi:hypothetical protein